MYSYLTYICYSYIYVTYMQHICGFGKGKNIIVVISPLTSLMKDQVMRLISLGITAISLAEITTEKQCNEVKNGDYSVVFGSPELWLGDEKWRKMARSDCYRKSVRAVAVDEAHVICHW